MLLMLGLSEVFNLKLNNALDFEKHFEKENLSKTTVAKILSFMKEQVMNLQFNNKKRSKDFGQNF